MSQHTSAYVQHISTRYKQGNATEHTYRGDLQQLIEQLAPGAMATNEPQRIACGAPDYVITLKDIPVGYIEAKDLGVSLDAIEKSEQLKRYRDSLENLILTDYVEFRLYRNGEKVTTINIAALQGGKLKPLTENYAAFETLLTDFCSQTGQTITSAEKLAKMMAGKARLMAHVLQTALEEDTADELNPDTELQKQFQAFQLMLIHDLTAQQFADIYAQTIAYGMFAARLHDPTIEDFTRREAAELIPASNPFLRKLFQNIAGYDLDVRLAWIVDALADVFRAADVKAILKNFGKSTQTHDPIIHFYETFLGEYNPAERKKRGVYYTPEPVVNFIVRAVDDILKTEFGLKDGLASTETTEIEVAAQGTDKRTKDNTKKVKQTVHKVQILDPATGTGTFLAEIVKHIHQKFEGQEGIWSDYVEKHLVPRLNGFEILMASYAMCHLKLDMLLTETGYKPKKQNRFKVYLTNSLEEAAENNLNLFTQWLSNESQEANAIKRDTPVMVVIGNPPYLGASRNKSDWIMNLMEDYKKEPGGTEKLKEKNPKWINDDYVKFLRFGQHFIEKNGEGVLAFINAHGYLDNPTFRGMRWNLLKTYDKVYVIDLHGNALKKETCPDGSEDQNVFDIQQGVCVNLFVKTGKKAPTELGKVYHLDLYGLRDAKYSFLNNARLGSIKFTELPNTAPTYYMVTKDFALEEEYQTCLSVASLFKQFTVGVATAKDDILVNYKKEELLKNVSTHYKIQSKEHFIRKFSYRPFDDRLVYYDKDIVERAREKVMSHFLANDNLGLIVNKQIRTKHVFHHWITRDVTDLHIIETANANPYVFPLYLYLEQTQTSNQKGLHSDRTPNLNSKIVEQIAKSIKLKFVPEKATADNEFTPVDLLDYIYAVLHSPAYREKYKEFLKIDFPRVPYPTNAKEFWKLVKLGTQLRELHLLESDTVDKLITKFPATGNNEVDKPRFEEGENGLGRVYINNEQYFDKVPVVAWEFYIGGYQPAQKWLKDRKGRALSFDDILHYQKMIVALTQTGELMKEIDKVIKL